MLLFLITAQFKAFAISPFELKGRTIILPAVQDSISWTSSFYDISVLKKGKFEKKFLLDKCDFLNDSVYVKDVLTLFPDKPQKQSVALVLSYKGRDFVFYLPCRFRYDMNPYNLFHINRVKSYNYKYITIDVDDIDIFCYLYDEVIQLRNTLICQTLYAKNTDSKGFKKFEPYTCSSVELSYDENHRFLSETYLYFLLATINDKNGNVIKVPVKPSTAYHYFLHKPGTDIRGVQDHSNIGTDGCYSENGDPFFFYKKEIFAEGERAADKTLIDSINSKFKSQEVFANIDDAIRYSRFQVLFLGSKDSRNSYESNWSKFNALDIKPLIKNDNETIKMGYYLILEKEGEPYCGILVDENLNRFVEIASERENRLNAERIEREQKQREHDRKLEQEEREYRNSLIRKFGKANASLILNEEIRLGFTKAMVEEAWGSPKDITTVTNYGGSVECWIYGVGSYVYFSGGKVVQIIN
jgi:hypothetical protein